jgi:hypothetical protein
MMGFSLAPVLWLAPVFLPDWPLIFLPRAAQMSSSDPAPRMTIWEGVLRAVDASSAAEKPVRTTVGATRDSVSVNVLHQMAHPLCEASKYYNLPPGSYTADFGAAAAVRDGWKACSDGVARRSGLRSCRYRCNTGGARTNAAV